MTDAEARDIHARWERQEEINREAARQIAALWAAVEELREKIRRLPARAWDHPRR
jgi:hypothetical protein